MLSSQLVLLLAGAAVGANAQSSSGSAGAKATLYNFAGLPLDSEATATVVASNSAATTYVFNCPSGSAASSMLSKASSAADDAKSSLAEFTSTATGAAASEVSSILDQASSLAGSAASDLPDMMEMTPIPRPTNAKRQLRLTPMAKPTAHARRADLDEFDGVNIECMPYTVVQGSETYGVKASVTGKPSFYGEFNATWKGDMKTADATATIFMDGDIDMLKKSSVGTAPATAILATSVEVAVVSGTPSSTPSGSGSDAQPSGTGAPQNSNPAAAGPIPTGAAVYLGAAAGLVGAVFAL